MPPLATEHQGLLPCPTRAVSPLAPTGGSAPVSLAKVQAIGEGEEEEATLPYFQSQSNAVLDAVAYIYPATPPTAKDKHFIEDPDNPRMFYPAIALEQIAARWNDADGPCGESRQRFEKLPWARDWLESRIRRAEYRKLVHSITNRNRVDLLCIFYPTDAPTDVDCISVALENNDLWYFRAAEWLREVLDAWDTGSPKLSGQNRKRLETLPWFRGWMERELDAVRATGLCEDARGEQAERGSKRQRLASASPIIGAVA